LLIDGTKAPKDRSIQFNRMLIYNINRKDSANKLRKTNSYTSISLWFLAEICPTIRNVNLLNSGELN
jgi:hypothetical protein